MAAISDTQQNPVLVWFRNDLRLAANPALIAAAATGQPVLAFFILDEESTDLRALGGASRWWLAQSLRALSNDLATLGVDLKILRGKAQTVVEALVASTGATAAFWNRRYSRAETTLDATIKASLRSKNLDARSFNGFLLYEPWEVQTKTGTPCKVFTPFWRNARALRTPEAPAPAPKHLRGYEGAVDIAGATTIDALDLEPRHPDWSTGLAARFTPGETGALSRLQNFLVNDLPGYATKRNRPDLPATSKLSPHLHFGEISPQLVWHAACDGVASGSSSALEHDLDVFLSELGWREFSYHLLHFNPDLPHKNFQPRFDAFPWRDDATALRAWQQGKTGYPIVDAGMRELWQTGFMHNRVRMIVASFLTKHLLLDWRLGEKWFWETLCDADAASNSASWQWVAGTGADAAPYFRVFNPILQGEKFDPDGTYVRRYVPELLLMPTKFLHKPWEAPAAVLAKAGVKLGQNYPKVIVAHETGRARALAAFDTISHA